MPIEHDTRQYAMGKTQESSGVIDGWRVLKFRRRIGYGKKCYMKVQRAVIGWSFEATVGNRLMGIIPAEAGTSTKHKKPRRSLLATFTEVRLPVPFKSLFVVNPVHVVKEVHNIKKKGSFMSSTAYATMQGHLLAGEERVTVIWRNDQRNEVDVEILS